MTVKPDELTPALFMRLYSVLEIRQKIMPDPARAEVLKSLASLRNNVAHAATRTEDVLRELSPMLPELLDYLHLLENSSLGTPFAKNMRVLSTPEDINDVLLRSIELEEAESRRIQKKKKNESTYSIHKEDPSSNATVQAAIAGDHAALGHFISWVRPLVHKYCNIRLGPRGLDPKAIADDIMMDVLNSLEKAPPSLENGQGILSFVYGIAAHHVAQKLRGEKLETGEVIGDLSGTLSNLLNLLPPKQREILVLRVVVGLSAEETAQAVGSTPGAVRIAQHRALAKLRKQIARMDTPYMFGENVAEY